jgi:hypothetical protein
MIVAFLNHEPLPMDMLGARSPGNMDSVGAMINAAVRPQPQPCRSTIKRLLPALYHRLLS